MFHPLRYLAESRIIRKRLNEVYCNHVIEKQLFNNYKRLLRQLKFSKASATNNTITVQGFSLEGFQMDTLVYLYRDVFLQGTYYFKTNNPTPTILDCGANIGTSVLFFKWLFPNAIIHAFEPSPAIFAKLQKNVSDNHLTQVFCHNVALSDTKTTLSFFEPEGVAGSLTGSLTQARNAGKPVEVQAIKLSDFISEYNINSIDYLKMDIEGAETAVIQNMDAANALHMIKQAGIEYHHQIAGQEASLGSFLNVFEKAGFRYSIFAEGLPSKTNEMRDVHLFMKQQQQDS